MVLIQDWMPPSRENYEFTLTVFKYFFPVVGSIQWVNNWYGMGKTSVVSRFNLPGRVGWFLMECPGMIIFGYIMWEMPKLHGIDVLPWQNLVLGGLFVIHYLYRAIAFPIMQPSMSPLHLTVVLAALSWQLLNATCLGAWLAAYGPVTEAAWASQCSHAQFVLGLAVWYLGLSSNFFHDEELRSIRRKEQKRQEVEARENGSNSSSSSKGGGGSKFTANVKKHYRIPEAGLFRYILFPHYLSEWIEWFGFWMAAGWGCVPARTFLVNEVFTMLPRAVKGREWYVEKFGEDKLKGKAAIIPGLI